MAKSGILDPVRQLALRAFGVLPKSVRLFVVRVASPNWTAGAVAIIEEDGRWLMVDPVYRKGWSLPGGLVDRGEDPAATVARELHEELGLDVEVVADEPWVLIDSRFRRIDLVFHARLAPDVDRDAIVSRSPELRGVAWFPPDHVPEVDREAGDVFSLVEQVRSGGSRVLVR